MFIVNNILVLILLNLRSSSSLVALPPVQDNDIRQTEAVIRLTINRLFSLLKLDPAARVKFNHFATVHNYLALLTLRDYNVLNDIAGLTRVNNSDNISIFTTDLFENFNDIHPKLDKNETDIAPDYIESLIEILKNVRNELFPNVDNVNLVQKLDSHSENVTDIDVWLSELLFNESDAEDFTDHSDEYWNNDTEQTPGTRRIFKGKRTAVKKYPFVASINIFGKFQCAGSIIKSDMIITAASCLQLVHNNRFFRENPEFLTARVGSSFYFGGGEVISVSEVYFYPTYDPKTLRDNVAIMRLQRVMIFKKKYVRIKMIEFDRKPHGLPTNVDGITIIGWGAKQKSNVVMDPFSNKISYQILDLYSLGECQDVYSKEYVTEKFFCAGYVSMGSGACTHDVGGPGIINGILMGVVSFGAPECGLSGFPTVFVKLGYYAHWIDEIISQDVMTGFSKTTLLQPEAIIYDPTTEREMMTPVVQIPHVEEEPCEETDVTSKPNKIARTEQRQDEIFKEYLQKILGSKEDITAFMLDTNMRQDPLYKTLLKYIDPSPKKIDDPSQDLRENVSGDDYNPDTQEDEIVIFDGENQINTTTSSEEELNNEAHDENLNKHESDSIDGWSLYDDTKPSINKKSDEQFASKEFQIGKGGPKKSSTEIWSYSEEIKSHQVPKMDENLYTVGYTDTMKTDVTTSINKKDDLKNISTEIKRIEKEDVESLLRKRKERTKQTYEQFASKEFQMGEGGPKKSTTPQQSYSEEIKSHQVPKMDENLVTGGYIETMKTDDKTSINKKDNFENISTESNRNAKAERKKSEDSLSQDLVDLFRKQSKALSELMELEKLLNSAAFKEHGFSISNGQHNSNKDEK